ncbi:type VI secretion system tip protein VgrG [Glaesserella sp.]|uniref:type VI secretion system Vgr family protein n=1 Tax=Glaesserella sp. TaxID=2094731 RepID=UPI00359F3797
MVKDLLSNVNNLAQVTEQAGNVADIVGADNLSDQVQKAQRKISQATNAVSTGTNALNAVKQFAQQGVNLSSAASLAGGVSSVTDLLGNEKLAAQAAKAQQVVSQATQAVAVAKDVIHRVQKISQAIKPISSSALTGGVPSEFSSPLDMLTALFKRSPSGLQFTLEIEGLSPTLFSVIEFRLNSRYNDLYRLDITLSSADSAIVPAMVLDNRAILTVWQDGTQQQTIAGMVADFEQGDSGFRLTHYRLKIYPDLWRATLRHNSRIFQQKDIQTILSTLLDENNVADYAFVLRQPHSAREFCVQYQETDFEFLQRITAEEGIFYYFEQHDGQHRLIFSDDAETLNTEQALLIPYNLNKNAQLQEKGITTFNRSERVRPSEASLKDYTFKKPNWSAQFHASANDAEHQRTGYEHYDFPGRFKDSRGKQYTQYRLDGLRQDAHLGWGESNSPELQIGRLFRLYNHPNESLNTFWQLTGIVYEGQQPQSSELEAGDNATTLTNRFEFIPRVQTWRPQQQTKPRVDGPQVAIVTGPPGEEIYTDKYGRIRLQFLWDREGQYNDHSSCWIRVTQPWAGKGWGMMAIPRVGHEIVVDFLEGDPDQPIVTGRTYHANMPLPAGFPNAKPQMDLMSQTHKGGGYNGIMMDDSTNGQRLNLHAQRDMNTKVLNNRSTNVKGNHSEVVMGNQVVTVVKNRYKEVIADESTTILKNSSASIGAEYRLLVQGDITFESLSSNIILETAGAKITLFNGGKIDIQGKEIQINGGEVHLNPSVDAPPSESGQISGGSGAAGGSGGAGGGEGGDSQVWTLTRNASPDGYIHNNQNGINSKATAFTASYGNGNASVKMLDMSIEGKNAGFKAKILAADGHFDNNNGISAKAEGVFTSAAVNAQLGDKNLGAGGSLEGKLGSAGGEATAKVYGGRDNIYGGEINLKAKASLVEAEAKGELNSRYLNARGSFGGSAGSVGGDLGGKTLIDLNKEVATVGVSGELAILLGLKGDLEVDVNYGVMRDDWKSIFNYD